MTDWILREGPKSNFRYTRSDGRVVRDAPVRGRHVAANDAADATDLELAGAA